MSSDPGQHDTRPGGLFTRHPLLKLCAHHAALGLGAALIVVIGLLAADAHGLRRLILSSPDGVLALALLYGGLAITLASVAVGIAIMTLPSQDASAGRGRRAPGAEPVRVAARAPTRRLR